MKVTPTQISDVLLIEPQVFGDERGFFLESFNLKNFKSATQSGVNFVQDNHSKSQRGVLRGLHYQLHYPQGKLIRVIRGEIYDVVVDLRQSSSTFKQWLGVSLSATNFYQLWIPPGFAHGFLVLSDVAEVLYKTTDYYHKDDEHTLLWSDPTLNIHWPITDPAQLILSEKDQAGKFFNQIPYYP
ncbi:dTDP-4-dehydrorhamnose 3,5-epimerase [Synechococcus sp. PCC 6312]|uniref:dTDP-4-dehydrorhamnose 3,5-epimerase n=1 Tax=Synechococcus sp. (strain ATCC 27167 / PCC 6312) TaxID=195253 RepID=UPI00029F3543|nr:dTDP-4-dehydrorhamnose 3,5-epimerase [Synechococcus sp. PCC 6312]AFY59740.1 dTDP-4-dehydrorhamnose 3,5-epimerase [Synechococcus sp. PCC 6312]